MGISQEKCIELLYMQNARAQDDWECFRTDMSMVALRLHSIK